MWRVAEIMFTAERGWSCRLSADLAIHTFYFLRMLDSGGPMGGVGMICKIR
jgi:hypothetical protein